MTLAAPAPTPERAQIIAQLERALEVVYKLAETGTRSWRMTIPPQPDDTDTLLCDALNAAIAALSSPSARGEEPRDSTPMLTLAVGQRVSMFDEVLGRRTSGRVVSSTQATVTVEWDDADSVHRTQFTRGKAIALLCAEPSWPAAPTPSEAPRVTCHWDRADDDTDMWETTCGHAFQFNDDGPVENGLKFCGYCGGKLVARRLSRSGRMRRQVPASPAAPPDGVGAKSAEQLLEVARIEQALHMRGFTRATAKHLGSEAEEAYLGAGVPGLNDWRRRKREAAIAAAEAQR